MREVNITLDGSGIKQVESAKFLGVHIDENINWKNHMLCLQQNCKTFWYTVSSKTLFSSRCYAGSILCTYLPIPIK